MDIKQWSLIGTVCIATIASAMDAKKKLNMPIEWFLLSCTIARDREREPEERMFLNRLPTEILSQILSYIHPKLMWDDWRVTQMVCDREFDVPYKIINFAVAPKEIAYFAEIAKESGKYIPRKIDLETGVRKIKSRGNQVFKTATKHDIPYQIAWSGKYIVYGNAQIDKECAVETWSCHPQSPLYAVIISTREILRSGLYVSTINRTMNRHLLNYVPTKEIRWHPTLEIFDVITNEGEHYICDKEEAVGQVKGTHVGFDSKGLHITNLRDFVISFTVCETDNEITHHTEEPPPSLGAAESVIGTMYYANRSLFLIEPELKTEDNKKARDAALHKATINRAPFSDYTHVLERFPLFNDPRYVRIYVGEKRSQIAVYIPCSRALLDHYCLCQAALCAKKDDKFSWNCFKDEKYKDLVTDTAHYYAYFKQLMETEQILEPS